MVSTKITSIEDLRKKYPISLYRMRAYGPDIEDINAKLPDLPLACIPNDDLLEWRFLSDEDKRRFIEAFPVVLS